MYLRNRNGKKATMEKAPKTTETDNDKRKAECKDIDLGIESKDIDLGIDTNSMNTIINGEKRIPLKSELRQTGSEFSSRTTAHGWGRVAAASSKPVKFLWLAVTILALIFCALHISILTVYYLSYSSEVKWQVSVDEITFPSVTVCNIQPMSVTTAQELIADPESNFHKWYNITQNLEKLEDWFQDVSGEGSLETAESRLQQPIGYYENIGEESQIVGHQSVDFILGCTFSQNRCSHSNFSFFQNAQYFNCYTFNGGDKTKAKLVTTMSGPHKGLSLVLYLENDSGHDILHGTYHTTANVGNAAGVRVVVHPPDTKPLPIEQGLDVPPGFSANIGLTVTKFERLNTPYEDCVEKGTRDGDWLVYSRHACISICQQQYVAQECGCVSSLLPHSGEFQNYSFCAQWLGNTHTSVTEYMESVICENRALNSYMDDTEVRAKCGCYPLCHETLYNTELSLSSWPLEFSQISFFEKYVRHHPNATNLKAYQNLAYYNDTELVHEQLISKNFARLNVYLKSMTIEEYVERKSYELPNLFSDIGGTCGLWIGMSVITWCEVTELVCFIVYKIFQRFSAPFQ